MNLALTFCTRIIVLGGTHDRVRHADATRPRTDWLALLLARLRRHGRRRRASVGLLSMTARWRAAARAGGSSARRGVCAAALLLPFVGPSPLDLSRVLARQPPDWSILVQLRLSRTLLGLFAGAALGLAGCVFQTMLRDALATPYTLGVSTGASLGAVVAIAFELGCLRRLGRVGGRIGGRGLRTVLRDRRHIMAIATLSPFGCCSPESRSTACVPR